MINGRMDFESKNLKYEIAWIFDYDFATSCEKDSHIANRMITVLAVISISIIKDTDMHRYMKILQ